MLQIDGINVENLTVKEALSLLIGKPNTPVTLCIEQSASEVLDLDTMNHASDLTMHAVNFLCFEMI